MRYFVSNQNSLFNSDNYKVISVEESLKILEPMRIVGLDTETEGFDVYTKKLLSVQIGDYENQVMIDCTTVDIRLYKDYLESDRIFILWNAKFDLKFFYHQRILINNVFDSYLAEKLLWLGYPPGMHGMGLKDAAMNYLNVVMDKTVRGKIINVGLTDEVVVYGCNDVKYLPDIRKLQLIKLEKADLLEAIRFENEFVKVLAYIEYCGVKLDVDKWKAKMTKDKERLLKAEKELNDWVAEYYVKNKGSKEYWVKKYLKIQDRMKEYEEVSTIPNEASNVDRIVNDGEVYYIYEVPYKFVSINLQGDLFSGFDTTPKCNINWNSAKQVIPLFELLGFNLKTFDKETGKSKKSIDAKIIEPQKSISPIAQVYLNYRANQKVVSTYGENFLKQINPITGRIHTQFNQLMDTARLSCGGKNRQTGEEYVNLQNLPKDAETRACFVAEPGNLWISADYKSQESVIIANVTQDPAMIDIFLNGDGDIHSLAAKMAFPKELEGIEVKDVKAKAHDYRDKGKKVEFGINYGGDGNTIAQNLALTKKEGERIYEDYMKGFIGLKLYQDFCRKDVMEKGYILLNPVTRHKAYIYDYAELIKTASTFTQEFWQQYRELKAMGDTDNSTVYSVKKYFKRKAASEKQSINYRIQGTGAMCFKLFSIKLFNSLKKANLLFTVKYCIPVHDEANLEAPAEIADKIAKLLVTCMKKAGDVFCTTVKLDADVVVSDHWIHE